MKWSRPVLDLGAGEEPPRLKRARQARDLVRYEIRLAWSRALQLGFAATLIAASLIALNGLVRSGRLAGSTQVLFAETGQLLSQMRPENLIAGFASVMVPSVITLALTSAPEPLAQFDVARGNSGPRHEATLELVQWVLYSGLMALSVLAALTLATTLTPDVVLISFTIMASSLVLASLIRPANTELEFLVETARHRRDRARALARQIESDLNEAEVPSAIVQCDSRWTGAALFTAVSLAPAVVPVLIWSIVGAVHSSWALVGQGSALSLVCGLLGAWALHAWARRNQPVDLRYRLGPGTSELIYIGLVTLAIVLFAIAAIVVGDGAVPVGQLLLSTVALSASVSVLLNQSVLRRLVDLHIFRDIEKVNIRQITYLAGNASSSATGWPAVHPPRARMTKEGSSTP